MLASNFTCRPTESQLARINKRHKQNVNAILMSVMLVLKNPNMYNSVSIRMGCGREKGHAVK